MYRISARLFLFSSFLTCWSLFVMFLSHTCYSVDDSVSLKNTKVLPKVVTDTETLQIEDFSLGRRDFSGQFAIFDHVIVGENFRMLGDRYNITVATQASFDRLIDIIQLSRSWDGPMSVAIFIIDMEFSAIKVLIEYLRECHKNLRDNAAFSFIYPLAHPPVSKDFSAVKSLFDCANPKPLVEALQKQVFTPFYKEWREKYKYPQNHLRNLARETSVTAYTMSLDVDIIFSPGATQQLSDFVKTEQANKCNKCVFTLAAYEVERIPKNKDDLLFLLKQQQAQPFHHVINKPCQHATNFTIFEESLRKNSIFQHLYSTSVEMIHTAKFEFLYEPFYLSLNSVPKYEERFLGYGFTRNTQTYELSVGGWSFKILSPVYLVHLGMKSLSQERPFWRVQQNDENRIIYKKFKNEVQARYHTVEIKKVVA